MIYSDSGEGIEHSRVRVYAYFCHANDAMDVVLPHFVATNAIANRYAVGYGGNRARRSRAPTLSGRNHYFTNHGRRRFLVFPRCGKEEIGNASLGKYITKLSVNSVLSIFVVEITYFHDLLCLFVCLFGCCCDFDSLLS